MKKYVCDVCGYVYDEAWAIPTTASPQVPRWEDLPEDFECPLRCGQGSVL